MLPKLLLHLSPGRAIYDGFVEPLMHVIFVTDFADVDRVAQDMVERPT